MESQNATSGETDKPAFIIPNKSNGDEQRVQLTIMEAVKRDHLLWSNLLPKTRMLLVKIGMTMIP